MVHHSYSLHHFHKGNRKSHKETRLKRFVDTFVYFIALVGPVMTIPQVAKIWIEQNAAGVSLISWSTYLVTSTFWLIYGIVHKEKPIIFSNIVWIFLNVVIVLGTIYYG